MKTITVKWTGIRPLVMANPQTVQLSNRYSMESRNLGRLGKAARKKQDEDRLIEIEQEQIRNDWESSAYWDDEAHKFYLPDTVILACIKSGAQALKKGKDIDRVVTMTETEAHIETVGHRTLDAAFKDKAFRLEMPCKIPPRTGAMIWKARCMIPSGWVVTFHLEFEETIIARKTLDQCIETAGLLCGVGAWRPKFGRFTVEIGE